MMFGDLGSIHPSRSRLTTDVLILTTDRFQACHRQQQQQQQQDSAHSTQQAAAAEQPVAPRCAVRRNPIG